MYNNNVKIVEIINDMIDGIEYSSDKVQRRRLLRLKKEVSCLMAEGSAYRDWKFLSVKQAYPSLISSLSECITTVSLMLTSPHNDLRGLLHSQYDDLRWAIQAFSRDTWWKVLWEDIGLSESKPAVVDFVCVYVTIALLFECVTPRLNGLPFDLLKAAQEQLWSPDNRNCIILRVTEVW